MLIFIFLFFAAYLMGSISAAILMAQIFKLPDPRLHGSRNAGATNILRLGGKTPALLTLIFDISKGVLPILIGKYLEFSEVQLGSLLFAALFGHLYPIFFRFQGGKGIATAFGGLLALNPISGIVLALSWLATAMVFRISSLASLTACVLAPFILFWRTQNLILSLIMTFISLILIIKHRNNIHRLYLGTEPKIGK